MPPDGALYLILLSIVLAISIFATIMIFRDSINGYYNSENSLYYALNDRDYASLASRGHDCYIGRERDSQNQKVADFYAVGRYFEEAFFANAFLQNEDTERAVRYREMMEQTEAEMGQFAGEKKNILTLFPDLQTP